MTLETVRSLVEAHSKEEIKKLTVDYRGGHGRVSVADLGFPGGARETFVSPIAVGRYFDWTDSRGEPQDKVKTALHALRLITGGHATEAQFRDIGNKQAKAVVREAAADVPKGTLGKSRPPEVS